MGIAVSYKFKTKNYRQAKNIVDNVEKTARNMKRFDYQKLKIKRWSPHEISVNYPDSETFYLNFEPLEKKIAACKKAEDKAAKGDWKDMWKCNEVMLLHETKYTDGAGKVHLEEPKIKIYPIRHEIDYDRPILGKTGYQTADFTKTEYSGVTGHIIVCNLLDAARKSPSKHIVKDEGDFCGDDDKKRDFSKLYAAFKESWGRLEAERDYLDKWGKDLK